MDAEQIGQVFRSTRRSKNWSIADTSAAAHIPARTLNRIEAGSDTNSGILTVTKYAIHLQLCLVVSQIGFMYTLDDADAVNKYGGIRNPPNITDYGAAIRKARKDAGKTLTEVAGSLGIGISKLSAIERGRIEANTGFHTYLKLLAEVGLTFDVREFITGYTMEEALADQMALKVHRDSHDFVLPENMKMKI